MTTITITKDSEDCYRALECNGHAGFADSGRDIVCAAISVLTINTINSVEKFADDRVTTYQDADKGIMGMRFTDKPSKEADLLMRSFELGVTSVFQQYGKRFLNIKFRRE
jgi:uncharacterized protein YsxB (DUF464 family)